MPATLEAQLRSSLSGASRLAIVGIGQQLRGDDGIGIWIAQKLQKALPADCTIPIKIFFAHTAPENLTGAIIAWKPSHIVFIDALNHHKPPGAVAILRSKQIGGTSFSTHALPLKLLVDYLNCSIKTNVVLIGIQPETVLFSRVISKSVKTAGRLICVLIAKLINNHCT